MAWREVAIERLEAGPFDLLVVGGGISGAGIALEATLRGYRCALVERYDFGSGTSRRSTKLIHGGLRYLLHGWADFVRESVAARTFLLQQAPGLVQPLSFVLPLQTSPEPAAFVRRFLKGYDGLAAASPLPPSRAVSVDELAQRVTIAPATGTGFEYHEAVTDDARLTLAVLRAAIERHAVAASRTSLVDLAPGGAGVHVTLRDELEGAQIELDVPHVIVAVGAWLSSLPGLASADLCPAKGTHLVLEQPPRPVESGVLLRHPRDGRFLTLAPWYGHLLLGSTDDECDPAELDRPLPTRSELEYLLEALSALAPDWIPRMTAAWSGVRPLLGQPGARTADLSREDRLLNVMPGVTAIAGGKLTTFRHLAQRCLDRLDAETGRRGGTEAFPMLVGELAPGIEGVDIEAELVTTLDDVLTQRMPLSLLRPEEAFASAPELASQVGAVLGWSAAEQARQVDDYRAGLDRFRVPA